MKRLLCFILTITIVGALTGCNSNSEIEALKKENNELNEQIKHLKTESIISENKEVELPIEIISQEATKTEYGYSYAEFLVKNISGGDINTLTLDIKILDENKTVIKTTHPQEGVVLANGESIIFEAMAEEGSYSMKLDGYNYYTGTNLENDYISGHFSDTEEVVLK